jgi:hypothetical protein
MPINRDAAWLGGDSVFEMASDRMISYLCRIGK